MQMQMGKDLNKASRDNIPLSLTKPEIAEYVWRFNGLDDGKKICIPTNDIRKSLKSKGMKVKGEQIHELLKDGRDRLQYKEIRRTHGVVESEEKKVMTGSHNFVMISK